VGQPLGFCAIRDDELDQLFVSPEARGTGLAARLLADGEARLAARGVKRAHLLCVIENTHAAAFYARKGWENVGAAIEAVQTENGPFRFKLLRFEKSLDAKSAPPQK
jgi:GNAT superfamily N-acetyltransferase